MKNVWAKDLMRAGRASSIPFGEQGPWRVEFAHVERDAPFPGDGRVCPAGLYTLLRHVPTNETVMSDNPIELAKHLQAAMLATGRMLITGLGLGCVLRMAQANPFVTSITVIERDQDVIDLVWPHTSHDRVELVHADALAYLSETDRTWDCAWHDLWTNQEVGEPSLHALHSKLMLACWRRVKHQGAWAFPRHFARAWRDASKRRQERMKGQSV